VQTFVISVLVFGLIILVHEFGHFLAARAYGVKVLEFAIGFGPQVLAVRRRETTYSLRVVPLGGFVRLAGTNPEEDDMNDPRGFNNQPVLRRMGIIFAGPLMNFLLAVALFSYIAFSYGIATPITSTTKVGDVIPGYPAAEAGLQAGDTILRVNDVEVILWDDLVRLIQKSPGQPLVLTVLRDGETVVLTVVPVENQQEPGKGFIGIAPPVNVTRPGLLGAVEAGARRTIDVTVVWIRSLVLMVLNRIEADIAGPVGIGRLVGQALEMGLANLLYLAGALSANIGLFNLLPIPALDGSRLVFLGIEGVRGKPIDPEKENFIHFVGFVLMMLLIVVVTYQDINKLGQGG